MVKNTTQEVEILYARRIIGLIVGLFLSFPSHCQWQRVTIGTDKDLTDISPVNGDTIYISGFDGLFKTNDFGKKWNLLTIDEPPGSYFYKTHFFNSRIGMGVGPIVMANSEAIAKTFDGGGRWNLVHADNGGTWPREFNDVEFPDSQNGYAIGTNGRVLYTRDAGDTWKVIVSDGYTDYLDGSFYSADQGYLLSGHQLKSIDNLGRLKVILKNSNLDFVSVEALSKNEIIISSETKIYRTSDGATWFIYDLPFSKVTTMFVQSSEIIFLGTENGVYVTHDSGSTWEWFKETKNQYVEDIYLRNDGKGFVVGSDGMMFQTTNLGGLSVPLVNFSYSVEGGCGYSYVHLENGSYETYDFKWFIDDQLVSTEYEDSIRFTESFSGEMSLIVSNGVASDTLTQSIDVHVDVFTANAGEDVFACYGEAVTLNPKTGPFSYSWYPTTGLSNPKIANPISSHPTTIEYILTVTTGYGCYKSDTVTVYRDEPIPEVKWERMNVNTEWDIIHMQMLNDTLGFAKTTNRVLRSYDGGRNWHEMGNPGGHNDMGKVHFVSADTGFVASRYLYRTTDGGKSYSRSIGDVTEIEFLNSKIGYAVTFSINSMSTIYKTLDGGRSWEKQYEKRGAINKIVCIDENNCTVGGVGRGVGSEMFLRTTDGRTWEKPTFISSDDDRHGIYDISFIDDKLGFAKGVNSTVWKTVDGGASWAIDYHVSGSDFMIEFFDRNRGLTGSIYGQFYQTINGGKCWQSIGETPPMRIRNMYIYKNEVFVYGSQPINSNGDGYNYGEIYRAKFLKTQTIRFKSIEERIFGDQDFHLQAQASSNLPVQYTSTNTSVAVVNGDSISIKGAGTAMITASQAGDEEYMAAKSVIQNLVVKRTDQTITFEILGDKIYGDDPFNLAASASSGLNVTFSVVSGHADLSGNTLSLKGSGKVIVKAVQEGNMNFEPAEVTQTFCVLPPSPIIAASGNTLSCNSSDSIQWFLDEELIYGATNSTYEAVSSGDYRVQVKGSCGASVYSNIYHLTITAIEPDFLKEVRLYPNPATDYITIDLPEGVDLLSTRVINSLGVPIKDFILEGNGTIIHVGRLRRGVYFLELITSNEMVVRKFIVQ